MIALLPLLTRKHVEWDGNLLTISRPELAAYGFPVLVLTTIVCIAIVVRLLPPKAHIGLISLVLALSLVSLSQMLRGDMQTPSPAIGCEGRDGMTYWLIPQDGDNDPMFGREIEHSGEDWKLEILDDFTIDDFERLYHHRSEPKVNVPIT